MYLSTTNTIMNKVFGSTRRYTVPEAIAALKAAGYDRVDISLWVLAAHGAPLDLDTWEQTVAEIAEASALHSLPVHQTHGNTAEGMEWDDPNYDWDYLTRTNLRALKATKRRQSARGKPEISCPLH